MIRNMAQSGKPKIWYPKEDYRLPADDGISMSTTSGSSNCGSSKEIRAMVYQGTRVKQQGDLFILQPSRMVIVESNHTRYRFIPNYDFAVLRRENGNEV
ncbi:hypothetical protein WH47_05194 [Habropoda laboriosa]|uniref:Uncharacterized protein n=1 Tax=Habropoda laboriosa TaxID=597456 RepID=A0A0L7QTW4_9HYME|nr:hypothetical protein WH47_05194 [Habropoda laboriosa]